MWPGRRGRCSTNRLHALCIRCHLREGSGARGCAGSGKRPKGLHPLAKEWSGRRHLHVGGEARSEGEGACCRACSRSCMSWTWTQMSTRCSSPRHSRCRGASGATSTCRCCCGRADSCCSFWHRHALRGSGDQQMSTACFRTLGCRKCAGLWRRAFHKLHACLHTRVTRKLYLGLVFDSKP